MDCKVNEPCEKNTECKYHKFFHGHPSLEKIVIVLVVVMDSTAECAKESTNQDNYYQIRKHGYSSFFSITTGNKRGHASPTKIARIVLLLIIISTSTNSHNCRFSPSGIVISSFVRVFKYLSKNPQSYQQAEYDHND